MNSQRIQFNRQRLALVLLAGLALAVTAGLAWAEADASGSIFQPAQMVKEGAYSLDPVHKGQSVAYAGGKVGGGMD